MTTAQQYLDAVLWKRKLQAKLKNVQADVDWLEGCLLQDWKEHGIESVKLYDDDSGNSWLLYQSTRIFARSEFVELAEVPLDLHMLSAQKAASQLQDLLATGDEEGLESLARLGITPIEKTQIHVKKG